MTQVLDTCVWCNSICKRPKGFDPKKNILVCSKECLQAEQQFRLYYTDELIGLRNYEQHGINPNHRGRNAPKKAKD